MTNVLTKEWIAFRASWDRVYGIKASGDIVEWDGTDETGEHIWKLVESPNELLQRWAKVELDWEKEMR